MMEAYRTLGGEGKSRVEDRRSVFHGFAVPVQSEAEAVAALNRIKAAYPDARHHVYAYCLRENAGGRYSDDGEPQGTGGIPILNVLKGGEITDALVVVVRYFGGTLLGTGGLMRAYSEAAKMAVEAAGVVQRRLCICFALSVGYGEYQRMNALLLVGGAFSVTAEFGAEVLLSGQIPAEEYSALAASVQEQSAGRVALRSLEEKFANVPERPEKKE